MARDGCAKDRLSRTARLEVGPHAVSSGTPFEAFAATFVVQPDRRLSDLVYAALQSEWRRSSIYFGCLGNMGIARPLVSPGF